MNLKSILVILAIVGFGIVAWELLCFNLGNPPNLC